MLGKILKRSLLVFLATLVAATYSAGPLYAVESSQGRRLFNQKNGVLFPTAETCAADPAVATGPIKATEFANPIYDKTQVPDPSIIKDETGQYVTYASGFQTFNSTNSTTWTKNPRSIFSTSTDSSAGYPLWLGSDHWAPDIKKTGDHYTIMLSGGNPKKIGYGVSDSAKGPFKDMGVLIDSTGESSGYVIDPNLFQISDSEFILYYGSSGKGITAQKVTLRGEKLVKEGSKKVVMAGDSGRFTTEAANVVKKDDYYYLFYSTGDYKVREDYDVRVARSKDPFGVFEKKGDLVLKSGSEFVGPGGGSVFTDDAGQDWFVYHARRPSGSLDRYLMMDKINYDNGWPSIGSGTPSSAKQPGPNVETKGTDTSASATTLPPSTSGTISSSKAPAGQIKVGQANIKATTSVSEFNSQLNNVLGTNPDLISGNEWVKEDKDIARPGYDFYRDNDPKASQATGRESKALVAMWKSDKWSKVDAGRVRITFDEDLTYNPGSGAESKDGKRSLIWVTLQDSGGNKFSFVVMHNMINPNKFGPRPERKAVYKKGMERAVEKITQLQATGPVVIAGDFNAQVGDSGSWHPRDVFSKIGIAAAYDTGPKVPTYVDWIFYTRQDLKVVSQAVPFQLEDHPYYTATLEFQGSTSYSGVPPSLTDVPSTDCICKDSASTSSSSTPVNGVDIDRLLKAIAQRESGGDPKAQSGSSSASGKYQYIDGTWQSRKSIYPPSGDYSHAKDAPESIQDAVAYIEYTQKVKDFGGDLTKIAVSHFYPIANDKPELMDVVPPSNSITPRQYAEGFIRSYEADEGSSITLKYRDAPEFDKYNTSSSASSDTPTDTTPVAGGDCSDTEDTDTSSGFENVDGISMFYQTKEPWASQSYGIGNIKDCGCGPTSLAIAAKTIGGANTDPKKMADWFVSNGGQVGGGSCASNWIWESRSSLFASTYDLNISSISASADAIKSSLSEDGTMVLMSQDNNGMFTSGGHIMLARGVNADGKILVADPNSEEYTKRSAGFSDQEIEAGLRAAWVIKKS